MHACSIEMRRNFGRSILVVGRVECGLGSRLFEFDGDLPGFLGGACKHTRKKKISTLNTSQAETK